jgi:hypothetical protein
MLVKHTVYYICKLFIDKIYKQSINIALICCLAT